jgi:hypothetical protein
MSDESTTTPAKKPRADKSTDSGAVETADAAEVVETPTVVETSAEDASVTVREVEVSETEPVAPTDQPDDVVTSVPRPQIIYVTAPAAPRPQGNRGFGALIALLSTLLFIVLLALVRVVAGLIVEGRFSVAFLGAPGFYAPVIAFLIGFVLLVLILNRAAWWSYILGSIFVGLFVYFGTIGIGLLATGIILATPAEAGQLFLDQLTNPFVIVSALLAREVSMWVGAGIAARGRRVKDRNIAARENYDRELAEKRAEHERGAATAV